MGHKIEAVAQTTAALLFIAFLVAAAVLGATFFFYALPYMLITGTECAPLWFAPCN